MKFDFKAVAKKSARHSKFDVPVPVPGLPRQFDFRPPDEQIAPKAPERIDILTWATKYRHIDGRPFSLERFRPLRDLYADTHPFQVYIKPAQVGVSEMAVTKVCWMLDAAATYFDLDKAGLNVGYLFPTQEALRDFSKERFSSLEREHRHIAKMFDSSFNNTTFKQVGESYLYLRGAWSEEALLSFPADMLVYDEYDRMDPSAVALAEKRLRQSMLKHQLFISTPTVPGHGIHALYLQSDQRVWEVTCTCGADVELDFFRDVRANGHAWDDWKYWDEQRLRRATFTVACPVCDQEIDRCGPGHWRAKEPDVVGIHGYQLPALCFPSVDLTMLALNATSNDPEIVQEFYRSDLGLPYEPSGSRVTLEMLQQLSHALLGGLLPTWSWRNTTMGIDVGKRFHYRISSIGPEGAVYVRDMGAVETWDACAALIKRYQVRMCVVDAMPEQHGSAAFASQFPGRVYRAFYPSERALKGKLVAQKDDERIVQINRTMAMDAVYNAIASGNERWPAAIHNAGEVQEGMRAPIRVTTKDAQGQEVASWVHTAPDHFYHASVYDRIAREILPRPVLLGVLAQAGAAGWSPS